jgi:hypothetical protein
VNVYMDRRFVTKGRRWAFGCVAVITLLVPGAGIAHAQAVDSFEELRARGLLTVGDAVAVRDRSGETCRGTVEALSDDQLRVGIDSARGRTERLFSEADVRRIRRADPPRMAVAGLSGALAGFGLAAVAAARYGGNEGGRFCGGCLVEWSTVTVPVGAGIGALVGFLIDKSSVRTVYAADSHTAALSIAPIVAKRTFGGVASIRF